MHQRTKFLDVLLYFLGSSFNNDLQILLITTPKVIAAIERRQF